MPLTCDNESVDLTPDAMRIIPYPGGHIRISHAGACRHADLFRDGEAYGVDLDPVLPLLPGGCDGWAEDDLVEAVRRGSSYA